MPRGNQLIRQWRILRFLEANGRVSLHRIARELDEKCHERTLRRDLKALEHAGFPLYDERENGTTYWALSDTYRLFPVPLTATELLTLHCGSEFLKPLEGTFVGDALHTLFQKTRSVLTEKNRSYLNLLQRGFSVGPIPHKVYRSHRAHIEQIREAIEKNRVIEMQYVPLRSDRSIKRRINPYVLWFQNGALYLIGYDHLRKEKRTYAVDRIKELRMTDRIFQPPLPFKIQDYFKDAFGVFRGKPEDVELVFEKKAARWVKERQWHASQKMTTLKGGRIRMNLRVAVSPELLTWVLGFGSQVQIVRPAHLAGTIQDEARKLIGRYQPAETSQDRRRAGKGFFLHQGGYVFTQKRPSVSAERTGQGVTPRTAARMPGRQSPDR